MEVKKALVGLICIQLYLSGCSGRNQAAELDFEHSNMRQRELEIVSVREDDERMEAPFDKDTPIDTVKKDPVFRNYGHLLFPVNDWYMDGDTLGKLRLTWYSHIDSEETVEIVNTLWQRANDGDLYPGRGRRRDRHLEQFR